MKVICKKNTSKLVKGGVYEVHVLRASTNNTRPTLTLKGAGWHSIDNFTNVDGTPIERKDWTSPQKIQHDEELKNTHISDVRVLKKGDPVVCNSQFSKLIDYGKTYKIEDVKHDEQDVKSWSGKMSKLVTQKIKIEGYNRWISPYRFRHCTTQEKRSISLGGLFDEQVDVAVISRKSRKIDRMEKSDKDRVILSTLFSSMFDTSRNNANVIEWAAKKGKKNYDIQESDFKPFLKMKISDIIKMIEIED